MSEFLGGTPLSHVAASACFIHRCPWFVTDSFFYPGASIFRMAWFAALLPAGLVDERAVSGVVLAHIPLPRALGSALGGLTAFIRLTRLGPGVVHCCCPAPLASHAFATSRGD